MFKTFLKIAWRNMLRRKTHTVINVVGLALGITACIVIYVITSHELTYDTFHPGKDRIYRVMGDIIESTGDKLHFAKVPLAVALTGKPALSGVDEMAAVVAYNAKISIAGIDKPDHYFESRKDGTHYITTVLTEPAYFSIFRYHWIAGNETTALQSAFSVVLTDTKARMYFGAGRFDKMIGRNIIYDDSLVVNVTGIIKQWDENTDLLFSDFISAATLQTSFLKNRINTNSWKQDAMSASVFFKLAETTSATQMNKQLAGIVQKHTDPGTNLSLWLEPLSAIHFNAEIIENPVRTAHMPTLYSLMGIALFILILAVINFINLSTAESIRRAKEVGVRKVLGSSRGNIVFQFLFETMLVTVIAVILALLFVNPVLAGFSSFIPQGITFHLFKPSALFFLFILIVVTSLLAGLYPAFTLSSWLPVASLRGVGHQGTENWLLRKGLIVFQFSVSLVFIVGSIVITKQLKYTREKDLGFSADAIVTIETPRDEGVSKIPFLARQIKQLPGVNGTALQWRSPMTDNPREMKLKRKSSDEKDFWVKQVAGDENYIPLYNIRLVAGRNLVKSDTVSEFVINESLSQFMGSKNPGEAVGKFLYWNDKPYPIVGVVADFHTNSLHDPMTPLCIINRQERQGTIAVKLASKGKQSAAIKTTLLQIESAWKQVYAAAPFNYSFYDQSLAMLYEKDRQTAILTNVSMLIAVFISCIGLFGLALFTAQKRAKEIGIRKILGATAANIAVMLGKDFLLPVLIALFIACPVAWYLMNHWLRDFAYRIEIGWDVFILAGIAAVIIALLTVGLQAIKAAIANPATNLKTE